MISRRPDGGILIDGARQGKRKLGPEQLVGAASHAGPGPDATEIGSSGFFPTSGFMPLDLTGVPPLMIAYFQVRLLAP